MDMNAFEGLNLWRQATAELVRKNDNASDLSSRQMAVLLFVYLTPPPHTVRALSSELNISKPAISRAIDRLSILGFLKRQTDENDRRSINLSRTIEGALFVTELGDIISKKSKELKENPQIGETLDL